MGVVGKNGHRRRRVRVKPSSSAKTSSSTFDEVSAIPKAAYIAAMSGELRLMAKGANLEFLSHLLAMAQTEAEHIAKSGK